MSVSASIASAASLPPLYRDWAFWSSFIAFLALAFSIFPLLWKWLRRPKLELELFDRVALTHKVGNPNLQVHLIISNIGGREVRISSVTALVSRDQGPAYALPARTYQLSGQALLFTPFTLRSGDQWANVVNFFASWGRENEQRYRGLQHALRDNINQKIAEREADNNQPVIADDRFVRPLIAMYESNANRWQPGQYELTMNVSTTSRRVRIERRYRFTLFETDAEELRRLTDDYKMGFGIYLNFPQRDPWVYLEVARL